MNKKHFLIFLAALFAFSIIAIAVSAQQPQGEEGMIGALLSPVGKLELVYAKFDTLIDAGIYLIIFLGLTQYSLGKIFKTGKGGKAISVGVAIVLAIGLALFERTAGFNIASFGPVAALILLALMGYAIWVGIKSMDVGADNLTMVAIAYVAVYFTMQAVVPNIIWWINNKVPIIGALLALLALIFVIYLLVKIIMFLMSLFGGGEGGGGGDGTPPPPPPGTGNVDHMKAYLIEARNALQKDLKNAIGEFETAVKHWGSEWTKNKDKKIAKKNAEAAVKVLEDNVKKSYEKAKKYLHGLSALAARCASDKRLSVVKTELERVRNVTDALISKDVNSIETCINYYREILRNFIRGHYWKKGSTIYPSNLVNTVLYGGMKAGTHIDNYLRQTYLKNSVDGIAPILKEVTEIEEKLESHRKKSAAEKREAERKAAEVKKKEAELEATKKKT